MYKTYDFECNKCQHVLVNVLVEGVDGKPDNCTACDNITDFTKLPSAVASPHNIIIDYPGSKQFKAGYVHTHARPAEKKANQVSMYSPKKAE